MEHWLKMGEILFQNINSMLIKVSLDVDAIAHCELTEEKNGRATFRIRYKKSDDIKHYDFESSPAVARKLFFIFFFILT